MGKRSPPLRISWKAGGRVPVLELDPWYKNDPRYDWPEDGPPEGPPNTLESDGDLPGKWIWDLIKGVAGIFCTTKKISGKRYETREGFSSLMERVEDE